MQATFAQSTRRYVYICGFYLEAAVFKEEP